MRNLIFGLIKSIGEFFPIVILGMLHGIIDSSTLFVVFITFLYVIGIAFIESEKKKYAIIGVIITSIPLLILFYLTNISIKNIVCVSVIFIICLTMVKIGLQNRNNKENIEE